MLPILILFLFGMLTKSQISMHYATLGLNLWFEKMVPALLPFMILSGIMIRTGIAQRLAVWMSLILSPVFHASKCGCYVIFMGFLCGFPMGARTISDLYARKEMSKEEALWLLSFSNNIGPIYFCSFVLPLFHLSPAYPFLFGMYGIPLLYGILLRYTKYKNLKNLNIRSCEPYMSFGNSLEESVNCSIQSILSLGGYMILFCLGNLLPHMILGRPLPILSPFLEITSGLNRLQGKYPIYCLALLMFGGLSCFAQTFSCLKNTDLKEHMGEYLLHKVLQTLLVFLYYFIIWKQYPHLLPF